MTEGSGPLDFDLSAPVAKVGRERDGRVCVCGHGARNHGANTSQYVDTPLEEIPRGELTCIAGRHQCACIQFQGVLVAGDMRRFMSRTIGPDRDHALARGVANALQAGAPVVWREGLTCGRCGAEGKLTPVAVRIQHDGTPVAARSTTEHNYLLCRDCRSKLYTEPDKTTLATTLVEGAYT